MRKGDHAAARYEVVPHEAAIVAGLFRRYADEGIAIAELAGGWAAPAWRPHRQDPLGPLHDLGHAATRLRGPGLFGKTGRVASGRRTGGRLAGRAAGAAYTTVDRPRGDWLEIDVRPGR